MRENGIKAGMLKIRCYRPFPAQQVAEALKGRKAVAVMERVAFFGGEGSPIFVDVATALYLRGIQTKLVNYTYGLGGRDTIPDQISSVFQNLTKIVETGKVEPVFRYLGLRDF
jgi:pyruvate ferredoxin oxidoreductase alpha subunit